MGGGVFKNEFTNHPDLAEDAGDYADRHKGAKEALEEAKDSNNKTGTLEAEDPNSATKELLDLARHAKTITQENGMVKAVYESGATLVARDKTSTPGSAAIDIRYIGQSGERTRMKWHLREHANEYRTKSGRRKKK